MNAITIRNFEWGYFWESYRGMSWCEFLMASVLALVAFRSYRRALVSIDGKSSILAFWIFVAAILGCGYKAFNNMDVATIPYVAFLIASFMDFRATLKRLRDLNDARAFAGRSSRSGASAASRESSSGKHSHTHTHSHGHSHSRDRSRHSRGSKRSSREGSGAGSTDKSSDNQVKEPVFDDPLAESGAVENAESRNE